MESLRARIETAAGPRVVWDVLTDAARYREWVPAVDGATGEVSHGQRIILHRGGGQRDALLHITASADRRFLRWEAVAPLGMVTDRCDFTLTGTGAGCAVEIEREVGGPLEHLLGDGPEDLDQWIQAAAAGLRDAVRRRCAGVQGEDAHRAAGW